MNVRAPTFDRSRHKFTLDAWAAMEAAGVLPRDVELELIDGDLIEMPADGALHRRFQAALLRAVFTHLPEDLVAIVDQTLPMDRHNGPKPDLYVYPASVHERDLTAADVVWALEIADSSLDYDREVKAALYARAGIKDFWIIDANAKAIIVLRDPSDGVYRTEQTFSANDAPSPLCAPTLALQLSALPRLD